MSKRASRVNKHGQHWKVINIVLLYMYIICYLDSELWVETARNLPLCPRLKLMEGSMDAKSCSFKSLLCCFGINPQLNSRPRSNWKFPSLQVKYSHISNLENLRCPSWFSTLCTPWDRDVKFQVFLRNTSCETG